LTFSKFDKIFTGLYCFMFKFGRAGLRSPMPTVATGLV